MFHVFQYGGEGGGGSEFLQVPEPMWGELRIFLGPRDYVRGEGRPQNFSESQSLYKGRRFITMSLRVDLFNIATYLK